MRILQKHGVVEGWTPETGGGLVAEGRLRARESIIRRRKGHGSIGDELKKASSLVRVGCRVSKTSTTTSYSSVYVLPFHCFLCLSVCLKLLA